MRLRDYILNNFWLKVFSMIMAGMIWFAVRSNLQGDGGRTPQNPFHPSETREYTRPIAIATRLENQQAFKVAPIEARVTVRGDRIFFRRLKASDIQVYVDLTEISQMHGAYPVRVNLTRAGANYIDVRPQYAQVEPDKGTK
ncbi:MAG: YbbR family protein [Verrucomicrobiales bacterium]|jgi:YbbR domain-containing protein|nr:YbbR family protein [Verrucomicrobiales bacterium]